MNIRVPEVLCRRAEELEQYYSRHYPALAPLAARCFLNTMETTVRRLEDGSYFVITGDIPAMWLRDSAAQVKPYIKYAAEDAQLREVLEGIIAKQASLVCIDPYANAFNCGPTGEGAQDKTEWNDWVWERKYEVDSLCAPVYLAYEYWKETGRKSIFTPGFRRMLDCVLCVFRTEQRHWESPYSFGRRNVRRSDTLPNGGKGRPVNHTGMTWSGFRPSDDSCRFGYLVPANAMAVVALTHAAEILRAAYQDEAAAMQCTALAREIREGLEDYALYPHPKYGIIYAYETDGFGNYNLMDDANSPSLLALPYLGFCSREDPVYQNTRRFVLSDSNPYYHEGTLARGVGSPHTPGGYVWHIGILMQALTSGDHGEILDCLSMLAATHAGCNVMHESFDPNEPAQFTRPWFAWANTLLGQLLDELMRDSFFE